MQKYIGRQLKTARLNKKLTQEQIAEAVGLSAKHYGCIERGEVSTTVAVLTRLYVHALALQRKCRGA